MYRSPDSCKKCTSYQWRGRGKFWYILYWSNQEACVSQKDITYDVVFALPVAGQGGGGLSGSSS
jgi:hypothetical protein